MNLITRYSPPKGIQTERQMFNAIAKDLGLAPVVAEQIWTGARLDLMNLKTQAREKFRAMET